MRVNNFVGGADSKGKGRDNAQSHSPSGLHASSGNNKVLKDGKVRKPLKVINNSSKSPYLNNVFLNKDGKNQQSITTQQSATDTSS